MVLTAIVLMLGSIICTGAWIWFLVVAFRVSVGWGLLVFFLGWTLIPLVIFAVHYWDQAKKPIMVYGAGCLVIVAAGAISTFALGLELDSLIDEGGELIARPDEGIDAKESVLPPPRPTAQPTHPSWEAIVREIDRDDNASWETFVPSPTPVTGRPAGSLSWEQLGSYIGRSVVVELENSTVITAALEAVEPQRLRVRHVIGGGEASYWIDRDQVSLVRRAK